MRPSIFVRAFLRASVRASLKSRGNRYLRTTEYDSIIYSFISCISCMCRTIYVALFIHSIHDSRATIKALFNQRIQRAHDTDLNSDPLVILIHRLSHVDFKGAVGLTFGTRSGFDFLVLILKEGTQDEAALGTVILDHTQLRHNTGCTSNHARGTDQLI